jgi:hypothetical protein
MGVLLTAAAIVVATAIDVWSERRWPRGAGINSLVVAHAYGLDMEITAEAVTWSTSIVVAGALFSLLP